jgi:hypothetical protein
MKVSIMLSVVLIIAVGVWPGRARMLPYHPLPNEPQADLIHVGDFVYVNDLGCARASEVRVPSITLRRCSTVETIYYHVREWWWNGMRT